MAKINKAALNKAVGNLKDTIALLEGAGVEIADGVYVTPGMLVDAVGFKNATQFTIAPKGTDPASRRVRGAISVYHTDDGTVGFVRRTQWTMRNGKECGLFVDGQPVIGYAD